MEKRDVKKIGKKMNDSQAKEWVENYQKKNPKATFGWLYGDDILQTLMKEKGCDGIWFFKGLDEKGEEKLVLFPADSEGNILGDELGSKDGGGSSSANSGQPCPPYCPK